MTVRPFLKWLGGKSRLLPQFEPLIPDKFTRYIEPFVGGGAVFLHISKNRKFKEAYLCDISEDLMSVWSSIQDNPKALCAEVQKLVDSYNRVQEDQRQTYYYAVREEHNTSDDSSSIERAARVIFLNKTCYNGLFRYNRKGTFNAPFGRYENPFFYDPENIETISAFLSKALLITGDFTSCEKYVTRGSFIYFDPPYRPLSKTSSFTSFTSGGFSDPDQERLAASFKRLDQKGAKIMLSNSDTEDGYFDQLYEGYKIHRVRANRAVNSNPDKRGKINELVITNY